MVRDQGRSFVVGVAWFLRSRSVAVDRSALYAALVDIHRSSARPQLYVSPFVPRLGLSLLLTFGLGGCQSGPVAKVADPPPYQVVLGSRQLMLTVLDPAADGIWDSAGTIITAEGRSELAPTTNEGWQAVYEDAALLAEVGNLLMMPGRAMGPDWVTYSQDLTRTGRLAMAAATAQDSNALFDAGGQVYQACRGCHEQYWRETTPVGEALPEPKL